MEVQKWKCHRMNKVNKQKKKKKKKEKTKILILKEIYNWRKYLNLKKIWEKQRLLEVELNTKTENRNTRNKKKMKNSKRAENNRKKLNIDWKGNMGFLKVEKEECIQMINYGWDENEAGRGKRQDTYLTYDPILDFTLTQHKWHIVARNLWAQ